MDAEKRAADRGDHLDGVEPTDREVGVDHDIGTPAASRPRNPAFLTALRDGSQPLDLVLLSVVPVVLVAVFQLPEEARRSLAFLYTDPTIVTAFTSHYVHLSADHLLGNLLSYVLLAGFGYIVAAVSGYRVFFFVALATFCLAFPWALSALNLAVPRHALAFGFSGVNMAIFGMLPLLLAVMARERLFTGGSLRPLPAVFFVLIGWMAFLAFPPSLEGFGIAGLAVSIAAGVIAVVYLFSSTPENRSFRAWGREIIAARGYGDCFVVGVVVLIGYPIIGFPAEPTGDGGIVNLYVHLLGFCLAFIVSYAAVSTGLFDE